MHCQSQVEKLSAKEDECQKQQDRLAQLRREKMNMAERIKVSSWETKAHTLHACTHMYMHACNCLI